MELTIREGGILLPTSDNLITKVAKAVSPSQTIVPKGTSPTQTIVAKGTSPTQTVTPKPYDLLLAAEDYVTLTAEDGTSLQLEG